MSHWNHRVIQRSLMEDGKLVKWFGIHECFYDLPDEDVTWTEEAVSVVGDSVDELRETLERMLGALDKPVIVEPEQPSSIDPATS